MVHRTVNMQEGNITEASQASLETYASLMSLIDKLSKRHQDDDKIVEGILNATAEHLAYYVLVYADPTNPEETVKERGGSVCDLFVKALNGKVQMIVQQCGGVTEAIMGGLQPPTDSVN